MRGLLARSSSLRHDEGSPLHVRGLPDDRVFVADGDGITPACAGTTQTGLIFIMLYKDHPCMCGDYLHEHTFFEYHKGSPLHMRGLLNLLSLQY